jgi:hypothetical protein
MFIASKRPDPFLLYQRHQGIFMFIALKRPDPFLLYPHILLFELVIEFQ